ncbi:GNAT family N-acetyltransferase [Sphingobium indicum]|uniref:Acetyltransferase n=2 Tax=Sphingobium indicum TaxID=332055 RepID=A0A1L5BQM1_SPHIB|nr:GNAT family N-acetyltransferase [Sphingobium indicum]APL95169.1 acetyltransferase [Sphingobium indicum B90A]KEY97109.1 acetyltransferase [Sphingomonas sp. BHC-A]NYI23458.1 GNAT superfamily N-acetyltransferase [Sphingobium indicum]RYM01674.1 GNAT family N-acetyltransferase [Sphingobium indicum]
MTQADLATPLRIERIGRDDMSLRALATLRMTVFRGWPYLYDGSLDYEAGYLSDFLSDETAVLVVARLGDIPIGMATASPMATQGEAVRAPFLAAGIDVRSLFYFGESVLLPQFRGLGVGHRFFDEREAAARSAGATGATFCAVDRDPDHPARPSETRDLTPFWTSRGYRMAPHLAMTMRWKEVGQPEESDHLMRFWLKSL